MPPPIFETLRLIVRRLTEGDIEELITVHADADAMRFVGDGEPLSRERCAEWVEVTRRNYATRGYGMTALVLRETGEVVGFCGLVHPGGQPGAELKYALKRTFWGRGLATEAAYAMLDYGVRELGLSKVIATIYPDNIASERVLRKEWSFWKIARTTTAPSPASSPGILPASHEIPPPHRAPRDQPDAGQVDVCDRPGTPISRKL